MKIEGKLYSKAATKQVSATFKKREFVVEYAENPSYPEFIKFELNQEKCNLLDSFQNGDWLEIDFNLRGRKWNNPDGEEIIFNQLQAWKVFKTVQPVSQQQSVNEPASAFQIQNISDATEDLPF